MKTLKLVGYTLGGLSGADADYHMVLHPTRWEWQRALISGLLFLFIEVLLATLVLIARFSRLENRLGEFERRVEEVRSQLD
jgi:hypothetical protein